MSPEQDDNSICAVAWSVLIVGAIVLGGALAWKWHSEAREKVVPIAGSAQAGVSDEQPDADDVQLAAPRAAKRLRIDDNDDVEAPTEAPRKESRILENDPGLVQRQAKMLRADASASEKSEAGPSSLVVTEEEIRKIEQKQLILQ